MLTFVRLRPYDKSQGHLLKTYISPSGRVYSAGQFGSPSPLFEVEASEEIAYIRSLENDQFEIVTCADRKAAAELVQKEMEERALEGMAAVRAPMVADKEKEVPLPKPQSAPRLAPIEEEAKGKEETPVEQKPKAPRGAKAKNNPEGDGK
jgi:hypothetical protein